MTIHHWTDEHGNEWMGNYNPEQEKREMEARCNTYIHEAGHLPGIQAHPDEGFGKGILIGLAISIPMWAGIIAAAVVIF